MKVLSLPVCCLWHLGARQDQGLQADASKSIERTGQPYTKGYSGGLVWARSEQRGST